VWTPPVPALDAPNWSCCNSQRKERAMTSMKMVGLDLAKSVFQVHGVDASGRIVVRKKLRRGQVLAFFAGLDRCLIGLEACATAHHWAPSLQSLGHVVRL